MRIKELQLIQPSKEVVEFFKKFMHEHEKGLKAIKTLAEIKEIAEPYYTLGSKDSPVAQILQKINECEGENEV